VADDPNSSLVARLTKWWKAEAPPAPEESGHWFVELVKTWGPAILAVIIIRSFIFEPFRIPSGSMVPTLLIGDHVVVTKFSYGIWFRTPTSIPWVDVKLPCCIRKELIDIGDPARGDIIVFMYPKDEDTNYIKRVVGIPGDRIKIRNNRIYLNGAEQITERAADFVFVDETCGADTKRQFVENLSGVSHPILTNSGNPGMLADKPDQEFTVPPGNVWVMGDNRDNSEDSRKWGFVRFDQIKGKAHRIWLSWNSCQGTYGGIRTERFMRDLYTPGAATSTFP
jgi:signal peptidase I